MAKLFETHRSSVRLTLLLPLLLIGPISAGCLKTPSPVELETADYGTFPTDYEQHIKDYMKSYLFDPYSAVYEFGQPFKSYYNVTPILGGEIGEYGYFVLTTINAKNRFGAYVGTTQYYFFVRNGVVKNCTRPALANTFYCN